MALPIESCVPSLDIMAQWIIGTHNDAPADAQAIGYEWYKRAHEYALTISPRSVRIGAGVIAALSPQKSWTENRRLASAILHGSKRIAQTQQNIAKALDIIDGSNPLEVLSHDPRERSQKTLSFYRLILDPSDAETVCVDRHALDVATLRARLLDPSLPWVSTLFLNRKGGYRLIADAYRLAATELECLPHQVQATTWIHWRQSKRPNASVKLEAF